MSTLTPKQQAFVDAYDGNATEAARKAGYKGNDVTLGAVGAENLKKPLIANAIKDRQENRQKSTIATREERQAFLTRVIRGEEKEEVVLGDQVVEVAPKMSDRLKATDLLCKSEGDFLTRVDHTTGGEKISAPMPLTKEALEAIAKKLEE